MPELPEVETIRRGLQKSICGKRIKNVEVRLPKLVALGPAVVSNVRRHIPARTARFRKLLQGRKILAIGRRAKMLLLKFSGGLTLLVHLKMTGQLIFAKKTERKTVKLFNKSNSPRFALPHRYTHAIFSFTDGSHLYYNDLRQFGYLRLVRDRDLPLVRELSEFGPEPLSKEFTLDYFINKAKGRPTLTIKQYLMDPKAVAGIGNIYSDEILFAAKIRPQRRLRSINRAEMRVIFKNISIILKKALKARGSSVGDFFKVDGSEGGFGRQHRVYGRYGQPCLECGERIERVKLGGRSSSYCPVCQR